MTPPDEILQAAAQALRSMKGKYEKQKLFATKEDSPEKRAALASAFENLNAMIQLYNRAEVVLDQLARLKAENDYLCAENERLRLRELDNKPLPQKPKPLNNLWLGTPAWQEVTAEAKRADSLRAAQEKWPELYGRWAEDPIS